MTKRFLIEFEVKSHCSLVGSPDIFKHRTESVEIHVANLRVQQGVVPAILLATVYLDGELIDTAIDGALEHLREYLHHLTFVTNCMFQPLRLCRAIDWTPGLVQRQCIVYSELFGQPDLPVELPEGIFETANFLQASETSPAFKRALRWFASGIAAEQIDDQFQYFWLAIEVLSTLEKSTVKVANLCPKCRGELSCTACNQVPTHKRYPAQHIEALFNKFIVNSDHAALFEDASGVRHALAHGDDLDEIEANGGVAAKHVVDIIGKLAWTALLHYFQVAPKPGLEPLRATLLQPNTFMHNVSQGGANLMVTSRDPEKPCLSDFPAVDISMTAVPLDEGTTG